MEIKQDDKFFTRIVSKDSSTANASCRVYYGGASGSIPFVWESRPGTPKHTFSDSTIPPLTPPPSYFSRSRSRSRHTSIFPKFMNTSRKKGTHASPSSSVSSSTTRTSSYSYSNSSSSSLSSWSTSRSSPAILSSRKRLCFSCSSSSIHDNEEVEDDDVVDKANYHGSGSGSHSTRVHRNHVDKGNWFFMKKMKSVFCTILGHGSS